MDLEAFFNWVVVLMMPIGALIVSPLPVRDEGLEQI